VDTLTLISGRWMPSRLRFPLLFLLPLILLGPALLGDKEFLPLPPVTQEPLASEYPEAAARAAAGAHRVATDRVFPILTDELEIRRQLFDGHLPTWDPKRGLGAPLAAGSMAAPWNPLRWPLLLLDPVTAGAWHALFSLVLAGLGMLLFLEGRGLKFTAAYFGALAFQGSGFVVANLHYVMKVDALAWAPVALWGVDLMYRGRKNAGLILFGGLAGSGLSGFPQVFVMVAALTLAWTLVRALEAIRVEREARFWWRSLLACVVFGGLGLGGGALHLLPMAEASALSTRQPQAPEDLEAQALPPAALATAVLPGLFGRPSATHPAAKEPAVWWLVGEEDLARGLVANRLEWQLFCGITVLGLVAAALLTRPRDALFPALVALGALGFVLGWPLVDSLYGLPGAGIGAPARAGAVAALGLAWLSAQGFDSLLDGHRSARVGTFLVAVGGFVLGVLLWWTVEPQRWAAALDEALLVRHGVDLETLRSFFSTEQASSAATRIADAGHDLMLFSAGLAFLANYAGRLTVRGSGVAGCALLLAEVVTAGLPHAEAVDMRGEPFPESEAITAVREAAGDGRVLRVDTSEDGLDEVLLLARPNMLSAYGIRDLTPYTPFPSEPLVAIWRDFDPAGLFRDGVARLSDPALLESRVLDALRVTCVLSTRPLDSAVLTPRYEREGFHVYERGGVLAPARVVQEQPFVENDPTLPPTEKGGDRSLPLPRWREQDFAPPTPGELQLTRPAPHRIDVGVRDSEGGWLVVHEGWAPGWKAVVNGEDVEVRRMEHVHFGVPLEAGDSPVRFKYEPWSLRWGALITLLSFLGALALTARRHKPRHRVHPFFRDAPPDPR